MKHVAVLLANGFEEIEAVTVIDVLRRAGLSVETAGLEKRQVEGAHGIRMQADTVLDEVLKDKDKLDLLVLPGGLPGAHHLRDDERVIDLIKYLNKKETPTAAICAAPVVLEKAGVLAGKKATSYPGHLDAVSNPSFQFTETNVVEDGPVVTSRGVGTALEFALALVERLLGQDKSKELAQKMLVAS